MWTHGFPVHDVSQLQTQSSWSTTSWLIPISHPDGRPSWLRASGSPVGPGALAIAFWREIKADGTNSFSTVDAPRHFEEPPKTMWRFQKLSRQEQARLSNLKAPEAKSPILRTLNAACDEVLRMTDSQLEFLLFELGKAWTQSTVTRSGQGTSEGLENHSR